MGKEHAVIRRRRQAEHGRGRHQAKEHQGVVVAVLALEMIEQPRRPRPFAAHPLQLLGARMRLGQQPRRQAVERRRIRLAFGHREAADTDAAHAVRTFGIVVLPRPHVARARGEHVDVVTVAEVLGEQPAGVLGPGGQVGAVAGRDERELHDVSLATARLPRRAAGPRRRGFHGGRGRRNAAAAAGEPPRERRHRRRRRCGDQPVEHLTVRALYDGPLVVRLVERPSILTQFASQRRIVEQPVQHGLELAAAGIEQPAIAAQALAGQDVAAAVGEHGHAEGPRLDHHHRQALEVRRHDERLGAGEHVVLVLVAHVSQMADARVRGTRQHRACRSARGRAAGRSGCAYCRK